MKKETQEEWKALLACHPTFQGIQKEIIEAFEIIKSCFEKGGALYLCGNGGSAADCEHIAGELLKSFKRPRPLSKGFAEKLIAFGEEGKRLAEGMEGGLPAISLCGHPAFSSAFANDKETVFTYAQEIGAWGKENDALLAISTSGNAQNCLYAVLAAKAKGMKTILLTGGTGGKIREKADISLIVPERETYKVQELHLPLYHGLCAMLESEFFV